MDELRQRIDQLDCQLVNLLNERAKVVVEVGKLKSKSDRPVYAPDREKQVFDRVLNANQGPLSDVTIRAIWRELMGGSFLLEKSPRIGYLGPQGSFSHAAACAIRRSTVRSGATPAWSATSVKAASGARRSAAATATSAWCRSRIQPAAA